MSLQRNRAMHMINVLDKLKEIQENYDNEDIQRGIDTAAKMNPVVETGFDDPALIKAVDVAVGGPEKRMKRTIGQTKARRGSFPSQNVRLPGKKDKTEDKDIGHDCATHFTHERFGEGTVIHGEHTLSEAGEVSHYDAEFVKEDGSTFTVRNIPVANMHETVVVEHSHPNKKKKRPQLNLGKFDEEVVDEGFVDPDLQDILDAHEDEYQAFRSGGEVASDLDSSGEFYSELYDYFVRSGEMPIGVAKARTEDPLYWIADYLDSMDDPYAVGENTVEEVHEEGNNDLADIIKLAGRKSVLGLNQNVTIAESTELSEEDELEEGTFGPHNLPNAKKDDDADDDDADDDVKKEDEEDEVKEGISVVGRNPDVGPATPMTKKKTKFKPREKTIDVMSGYDGESDNESIKEEGIEETVEVPLSELADLLRLAGYENYEEKLAEYENAPEEEYLDVEDQLIGLAGGLNRPKTMHPTVAGGDNPMAVIPVKVDEENMFEKIYQNYQGFKEDQKKTLD